MAGPLRGEVIVPDLYIDVMVPTDGCHCRQLDLGEFADAIEAGMVPVGPVVTWQG